MVKIHSHCSRGQSLPVCAILTLMSFSLNLDITATVSCFLSDGNRFYGRKIAGFNYVIN